MGGGRPLRRLCRRCGAGRGAVRDRDPPAERDFGPPHGARPQQHHPGRSHSLAPDAGTRHAVGSGHRSRRDRHAERRGEAPRRRGEDPARPGPRGVRRARLGARSRHRRPHPGPAQGDRLQLRLGPDALHTRRGALARRAGDLRAAVRGRPHLPRRIHHQLVPPLPDRPFQRGGGGHRGARFALAPAIPPRPGPRGRRRGRPRVGRRSRGPAARRPLVPSPPPAPRPCSATPGWP